MSTITTQRPVAIEYVDPTLLIIGDNVRTAGVEESITAEFVDSIRENGVLTPITGWRDDEGVHVLYGQRRTLGARAAGTAEIPVLLIDPVDAIRRITEQLVENDQRADLTDAQRVQAWKALQLEGLSVPEIAKRTGTKRDRIKTGITVADNFLADSAILSHDLTIDQAATLIEFEDDEDLVAELVDVATMKPAQFEHAAQRARDEKARIAAEESTVAGLLEQGFTILQRRPGYYEKTPVHISTLIDARTGDKVTPEMITGLPGSAVYVHAFSATNIDTVYFIEDPKAHGFKKRPADGIATGPMTDEQKAERKRVIENNAAWDSAEKVRRAWLAELLTRKTLPKDTALFIARGLTEARYPVSKAIGSGNGLAAKLLGVERKPGHYGDMLAGYLEAHPGKVGHLTLAIILGGIEDSTSRETWRRPSTDTATYLQTLAAWGYALSPVEEIAAMIDTNSTR